MSLTKAAVFFYPPVLLPSLPQDLNPHGAQLKEQKRGRMHSFQDMTPHVLAGDNAHYSAMHRQD